MNRATVRAISKNVPHNVTIINPGPHKSAERCDRCRACVVKRGGVVIPLKRFEDRYACIDCVRVCRSKYAAVAKVMGVTCRELTARVRHNATELADGEAVMPWDWSTAAEMVALDAGIAPEAIVRQQRADAEAAKAVSLPEQIRREKAQMGEGTDDQRVEAAERRAWSASP